MARTSRRRPANWLRSAARMWRRSLRLRVVALTLLLSSFVVALLGVFLIGRVGHGLLSDKRQAALGDVSSGLVYARGQLASATRTDPNSVDALVETIATELGRRGSPSGLFDVAVLPTNGSQYFSGKIAASDIPDSLRQQVRGGAEAETYASLSLDSGVDRALIVGAPLTADVGSYEVYYVFPLHNEEQTLALVRRVLLLGGAALVGLLAAVVWLVSRQVVTPVRMAARIAERFAAGNLAERMAVHGDDEIARLAASFNDMAGVLQRQIDQLEELSRAQRRFTADVSHELRTPLATIRMAADVLYESRGDFPPAMSRSAEILTGQLERFERLLADLLEISRYDARAAILEPDTVDVAGLVRATAAEFADAAARAGTRIEVDVRGDVAGATLFPATAGVLAEVDSRRVSRILRNLLANAIDYADGAPVELTVAASEDTVAIRVLDHGAGLRSGDAERVFDRFWRADPSRSRATGGTGLGLSIAREDARLHGGELVAWGRHGQGASFRLLLPRRAGGRLGAPPLPLNPDPTLARAT
jgi:two-component system, OmpR family, sensor histidine kinase MtrB